MSHHFSVKKLIPGGFGGGWHHATLGVNQNGLYHGAPFSSSSASWQVLIRPASRTTPLARNRAGRCWITWPTPIFNTALFCLAARSARLRSCRRKCHFLKLNPPECGPLQPSSESWGERTFLGRPSLSATQNGRVLTMPLHPLKILTSHKHTCTHPWTHVVTQPWLFHLQLPQFLKLLCCSFTVSENDFHVFWGVPIGEGVSVRGESQRETGNKGN